MGGNSGIMFHGTNDERNAWATGPEFQLEDNAKAARPQFGVAGYTAFTSLQSIGIQRKS